MEPRIKKFASQFGKKIGSPYHLPSAVVTVLKKRRKKIDFAPEDMPDPKSA